MAKTGEVFAIKTAIGDAYFQFVKTIAPMGSLIRVLPGTYADRQPELASLVAVLTLSFGGSKFLRVVPERNGLESYVITTRYGICPVVVN
ncbi:hypothetical protein [Paraburkholderia tropica]|uniref:hypothetical protein n=1 Tax=Paraburkholderia tropica TaxID=92647 RepID=UPI002AB630EA|nr:hypothetical protein [Paraburkholderia tropica]